MTKISCPASPPCALIEFPNNEPFDLHGVTWEIQGTATVVRGTSISPTGPKQITLIIQCSHTVQISDRTCVLRPKPPKQIPDQSPEQLN